MFGVVRTGLLVRIKYWLDRYSAFYRITKEAIEIIRVLNERRDVDAIFDA